MRSDACQLDLSALLALLRSGELLARGENSVLMMADAWVSGSNGSSCSE